MLIYRVFMIAASWFFYHFEIARKMMISPISSTLCNSLIVLPGTDLKQFYCVHSKNKFQ